MSLQRELKYEIIENILIVRFMGEINFFHHHEFEEILKNNCKKCKHLIIDMTGVTYINSSGINIILNASKIANIKVVGPRNKFVSNILDIFQSGKSINIYETIEEALKNINKEKSKSV